jgi:hypothetical protein
MKTGHMSPIGTGVSNPAKNDFLTHIRPVSFHIDSAIITIIYVVCGRIIKHGLQFALSNRDQKTPYRRRVNPIWAVDEINRCSDIYRMICRQEPSHETHEESLSHRTEETRI